MTEELIFEDHAAHNSYMALQGYHVTDGLQVSEYITIVKVKKLIRQLTDSELLQINQVSIKTLHRFNTLTREKLIEKLSNIPFIRILRALYVRETDGPVDAMLCLLNKKAYSYDLRFLNHYFKYGRVPEPAGR